MTSWSEGYVSDIAYSLGFYREMAPDHIAYAALGLGKSAGQALTPTRVLELGFGMGDGFVLSAAAQPSCHFEGCDFNPEHTAHARGLADAAGLDNITIREASFQDLAAEAREGQQDCDIIRLHGILTWVSQEAQAAIVEIARKRLKPGGLLYVSYNCLPGWAQMLPVQRLMREHAKRNSGNSLARTSGAMAFVKELSAAKGNFFVANPAIEVRLEKMAKQAPSYLAHEYLNENWFIFHVADVAEMMGGAKLSYLGSASIAENIDTVAVPEAMRATIGQATDPIWKETLRDFASNKQFRRDVYARGIADLNNSETLAALHATHYTLAMPRSAVTLKLQGPLGELDAKAEIYGPIADRLDGRIVPFDEIATLPGMMGVGLAGTLQSLALMVHAGQVLPLVTAPNTDLGPGQRYNRVIAAHAERGRFYNFVAAPVARSGLPATSTELMLLSGIFAGHEQNPAGLAEHVAMLLRRNGVSLTREGETVTDPAMLHEMLAKEVQTFLNGKLPLWRHLGAL